MFRIPKMVSKGIFTAANNMVAFPAPIPTIPPFYSCYLLGLSGIDPMPNSRG